MFRATPKQIAISWGIFRSLAFWSDGRELQLATASLALDLFGYPHGMDPESVQKIHITSHIQPRLART